MPTKRIGPFGCLLDQAGYIVGYRNATTGLDVSGSLFNANFGLAANMPEATPYNKGEFYLATDENGGTAYMSDGTSMIQIAAGVLFETDAHRWIAPGSYEQIIATPNPIVGQSALVTGVGLVDAPPRLVYTANGWKWPSYPQLIARGGPVTAVQNTGELTMVTVATPIMGANDGIMTKQQYTFTASTNVKKFKNRLGGNSGYATQTSTGTDTTLYIETAFRNQGATNAQIWSRNSKEQLLSYDNDTFGTTATQTNAASTLTMTMEKDAAGVAASESCILNNYEVYLIGGG